MAGTLEIVFEIPRLTLLSEGEKTTEELQGHVGMSVQKLVYTSGAINVWDLPAAEPAIHGTLDLQGTIPIARCRIPIPAADEMALYRCAIMKTGATLDAQGKVRDPNPHATEEEWLLCVVAKHDGQPSASRADNKSIPGVQYVIIPVTAEP